MATEEQVNNLLVKIAEQAAGQTQALADAALAADKKFNLMQEQQSKSMAMILEMMVNAQKVADGAGAKRDEAKETEEKDKKRKLHAKGYSNIEKLEHKDQWDQ